MDIDNSVRQPLPDPTLQASPPPPPPPRKDPEQAAHAALAAIPQASICGVMTMHTTLYVNGISPGDINQGPVRDCTLQATLASLARTPEGRAVISRGLEDLKDASGMPSYRVTLYKKDAAGAVVQTKIDVDACDIKGWGVKHSLDAADRRESWPQVIEAAMLKLNGATCVNVPDAYQLLTGTRATDTSTSAATFAARVTMGWQTNKVQVLSTTGASSTDLEKAGLKAEHAYTVVSVFTLLNQTIVTVRNPWGYDDPRSFTLDEVKKYFPTYSEAALP